MNRNSYRTSALCLVSIALSLSIAMPALSQNTHTLAEEVESANSIAHGTIIVRVHGLVCDFCAQGLYKMFKRKGLVQDIKVNLETGLVTLRPKDEVSITDEIITDIMLGNGFSVSSIKRY